MSIKYHSCYLYLVALFLSISCSSPTGKYREDTIAFNAYLEKHQFDKSLTSDSIDFVLVSSSACHGCVQKSFNRLLAEKKVILVASTQTLHHNSDLIANSKNYLEDNTDDLDRLKYHNRNIGIVRMHNMKIYDLVYMDPSTIDSVINKLYGIR